MYSRNTKKKTNQPTASNNKSERPQVNIFGHLKDFEISKYKRFFSLEISKYKRESKRR